MSSRGKLPSVGNSQPLGETLLRLQSRPPQELLEVLPLVKAMLGAQVEFKSVQEAPPGEVELFFQAQT